MTLFTAFLLAMGIVLVWCVVAGYIGYRLSIFKWGDEHEDNSVG